MTSALVASSPALSHMSPDLDQRLSERYPAIFADRTNAAARMSLGFSCGNGWFNLIDRLCFRIQSDVDQGDRPQPIASQVKEKLGALRICWQNADVVVRELTQLVGDLSLVTCEVCGAPGECLRSPKRAVVTRCVAHAHLDDASCNGGGDIALETLCVHRDDALFRRAVEIVVRRQRASVSLLQRHLKLGYECAIRLMAQLEAARVVSAVDVDGERKVIQPFELLKNLVPLQPRGLLPEADPLPGDV